MTTTRLRTLWRAVRSRLTGVRVIGLVLTALIIAGWVQDQARQHDRDAFVRCVAAALEQEAQAIQAARLAAAATQTALNDVLQAQTRLIRNGLTPTQVAIYQGYVDTYLAAQDTAKKVREENPLPETPLDTCRTRTFN